MRVFAPLVWIAVLQVFILTLLASSPVLHEYFHSDAHDTGHHCLTTDFQSGILDPTVVPPIEAPDFLPAAIDRIAISAEARQSLPHHLCGSLLEHGPPGIV